ncbi:MAG: hypothetical protein AB7T63_15650 [Planctomycetota bacterium]
MSLAAAGRLGAALLTFLLLLVTPWRMHGAAGGEPTADALLLVRRVAVRATSRVRFAGWAVKRDPDEKQVKQAIARGCAWLVAHQEQDGSFLGEASTEYRTGLSALALLALMDAGHGPDDATPEGGALRKGLAFLLASQDDEGCVGPRGTGPYIHGHAFGAYALVRAYEVSRTPALQRGAQAALHFTALARNPYFAYRYGVKPNDNDTEVTGSMMLAIAEAESINAEVPEGDAPLLWFDPGAWDGVRTWLDKVTDLRTGQAGYLARGRRPARYGDEHEGKFPAELSESTTAVGAWCRMRWGDDPNRVELLEQGLGRIAALPPEWNAPHGRIDQYFWMWGARVAHEVDRWGGKVAKRLLPWRTEAAAALLPAQVEGADPAPDAGSWPPEGAWGRWGGRVYSTALAISTLQHAAYRGVERPEDADKARIAQMRDPDIDVDARLAVIESVPAEASTALVDALAELLRDPLPLVRLAAAEALARVGHGAAPKATRVARLLGSEDQLEVRHALLLALLRMQRSTQSVRAALASAVDDPDPGVRALAELAREGLETDVASARVKSLARLRSAAEVLATLEDRGQLGLEGVPARVAAVQWRLLRKIGLPRFLGERVGERLALLPTSPLEEATVLEAVERALATVPLVGAPRQDARALIDAAVAEIEALPAGPGARARLAAAMELHLARSTLGSSNAVATEVVVRLQRHAVVLREVAPTLPELERVACRVVERWCTAAIEAVVSKDADTETAGRLTAAIDGHGALARELRCYPELVRWIHLARAHLQERLARATQDEAAMALAREQALDLLAAPLDTAEGQRVALQAAAHAARLAPRVGGSRVASPVRQELPAAPLLEVVTEDGVRVELMDVALQQLPLLEPSDGPRLSASEHLVVRLRTTPTKSAIARPGRVWPLWVRVRGAAEPGEVNFLPYRAEQRPLPFDLDALGGSSEPSGAVPVGQSVVTIHVFRVTEPELAEGVEVAIQTAGARWQDLEPLLLRTLPAWAVVRKVPWTQLLDATRRELLQRVPDVDASPEGVDALLVFAALEAQAGVLDVAQATAARAEAAARALGDVERVVRAQQLWVSLEGK